jgi:hypothetical protein
MTPLCPDRPLFGQKTREQRVLGSEFRTRVSDIRVFRVEVTTFAGTRLSTSVLNGAFSDGSLYPALHKLEQEGWITALHQSRSSMTPQ